MSTSTSETGHAINISNYKLLVTTCKGFGSDYNPSNESLFLTAMSDQATSAENSDADLSKTEADMKEPINDRELLFDPLGGLVTQVVSALNSTKASALVKKDAKTIADRIRGISKGKKKKSGGTDAGSELSSVSQSHQSYVQRANDLLDLANLLATVTEYKPNEEPLKVASLLNLQKQMQVSNDGIGAVLDNGGRALLTRNRALYLPDTGMLGTAKLCRQYVKSVFGVKAAEYKRVSAIKFRDLPKKQRAKL